MKNRLIGLLLVGVLMVVAASGLWRTPITEYKPKNDEEHAITQVFIQYITARNHRDVDQFLSILHNDCQYMVNHESIVSKKVLAGMLPALWMQNDDNSAVFGKCMTWECINENYYKTGMLVNPKFRISNNHADVEIKFCSGVFMDDNYFDLAKENGKWQITQFWRPIN